MLLMFLLKKILNFNTKQATLVRWSVVTLVRSPTLLSLYHYRQCSVRAVTVDVFRPYNTSLSLQIMNASIKLECYITLGCKGVPVTNTLA